MKSKQGMEEASVQSRSERKNNILYGQFSLDWEIGERREWDKREKRARGNSRVCLGSYEKRLVYPLFEGDIILHVNVQCCP